MIMDNKRKKKLFWQVPFLILIIAGTVFIIRQQHNAPYQHHTGFVFGTVYNVTYQSDESLQADIEAELAKVDRALSMFNDSSVISHVNRGDSLIDESEEGAMFMEVYRLAERISAETGGAFDITVAPLVNAWGFGFKTGEQPTVHQVDSILRFVDYRKVAAFELDGKVGIRKRDPRVMLDCSAIAKGYGTDMVARLLRNKGIDNFMVEVGGEVVTQGVSPRRLPWRVAVTKPIDDTLSIHSEVQTVLNITDCAMATSGNYRNYYYKNGRKYSHTIDPRTGFPVQHSILSATVISSNCAIADAYATAFMVLGMDDARHVLSQHPELKVYFIYSNEKNELAVWYSPELSEKIND